MPTNSDNTQNPAEPRLNKDPEAIAANSHNTGTASAHWYVIHTKPRQERRALDNLQQQSFEVYLPLVKAEKLQRSKLVTIEEPLFKRYLFVRFDAERSPWHVIRNTFGVSELVRTGGQLARVPLEIIERLKQYEATPQALFNAGETLRVKTGPFQNLDVVFDMQDGDSRAIVLIELLNNTQKISLNINSLTRKV